jgi:transcriptional regulator with XRE-family HTH domain
MASLVKDVGHKIRLLRLGRSGGRMTQEHLSERAGISVSFLSMIERGERSPHLETLARIAEALGVAVSELFIGAEVVVSDGVDPLFQPLLEACRKLNLGKREVDRLVGVMRTMFA